MSSRVLDSSAVLALIFEEPGAAQVRDAIDAGAVLSTVSMSEVVARLADQGANYPQIAVTLAPLKLDVVPFSDSQAWQAGMLRPLTRALGLSLGDRCCLALAMELGLPVLTADRAWAQLDLGVDVVVCR